MQSLSRIAEQPTQSGAQWWIPLLVDGQLAPPDPEELPENVPRSLTGFAIRHADRCRDALAQIANVGPMTRGDLAILGIKAPANLAASDGSALYVKLQRLTGLSIDPCQHDVMLAIVSEARGLPPEKWWAFTSTRKTLPDLRLPKEFMRTR